MSMTIITTDGPCELLDNGLIMVEDDETAKLFLAKHGKLAEIETCPMRFTAVFFQTENAYCAGTKHKGYGTDNGYTAILMPKTVFTAEQAAQFMAGLFVEHCPDVSEFKQGPPNRN